MIELTEQSQGFATLNVFKACPKDCLADVLDVRNEGAGIFKYVEDFTGQTVSDDMIIAWLQAASQELEMLTYRHFLPRRQTEWYNGNDQTTLTLRRFPVLEVHRVRIWGGRHFLIWEFIPEMICYEGKYDEETYRKSELLVRGEIGELVIILGLLEWGFPLRVRPPLFVWNRRFVYGIQNIEVDYTAGFGIKVNNEWLPTPTPLIRRATTLLACIKAADWAASIGGGVASRTLGDRTENYGGEGVFGTTVRRWRDELWGDGRREGLIQRLRTIYAR